MKMDRDRHRLLGFSPLVLRWFVLLNLLASIPLAAETAAECICQHPVRPDDVQYYFERLADRGFSGAVLVTRGRKVLFRGAYGYADEATKVPNTSDTVFDLGSISKQLTAAAILSLVREKGGLSLRAPISHYLSGVPGDKAGITIHHLLTHSSGLTEHSRDDREPLSKSEAIERIFRSPLAFSPGSKYRYSNSGYTVLAAIVEQVSKEDFPTYMRKHVFAPAGMQSTGFYAEPRWHTMRIAHGYLNGMDQGSLASWPGPYWGPMGNGEIFSTVEDMHRWFLALRNGSVVPRNRVNLMLERYVAKEGVNPWYGYGMVLGDTELGRVAHHDGGGSGGNANAAWYLDEDLYIVVLSNRIWSQDDWELLPANEARRGLARAIASGNFDDLPTMTPPTSMAPPAR